MCPACLTAAGLYVAGGVSAAAVTTLVVKLLPAKKADSNETGDKDATDDRIEK
jgi:hypothetical protein